MTEARQEGGAPGGVQSVHLALSILETLAQAERDLGVTELAARLGTSKARIYRHLQTLKDRGYVDQRGETEKYYLGIGAYLIGQSIEAQSSLISAARPAMASLRDTIGQSVVLSTLHRGEVVIVDVLRGHQDVEIGLRLGARLALHATAQGFLALAFGPESLLQKVLSGERDVLTPKTLTDDFVLQVILRKVRDKGWATSPEMAVVGINALAAPVLDHKGRFAAGLAIVGSIQYVPETPPAEQVDAVLGAAEQISRALGYRGDMPGAKSGG